jgi:molybdenum cofactor guanylyltransferase
MRTVSAAILVGGRARRFDGQLKAALRIGARTILERQIDAIATAGLGDPLLVGRSPLLSVPLRRQVSDAVADCGALGGLYTALLAAPTPVVIVLAGDLPFVSPALLLELASLHLNDEAVVPRTDSGWHPLCAAYRRTIASRMKTRLDRRALRISDALADLRVRALTTDELERYGAHDMLLMNVNTPDDYRQAERYARTYA